MIHIRMSNSVMISRGKGAFLWTIPVEHYDLSPIKTCHHTLGLATSRRRASPSLGGSLFGYGFDAKQINNPLRHQMDLHHDGGLSYCGYLNRGFYA